MEATGESIGIVAATSFRPAPLGQRFGALVVDRALSGLICGIGFVPVLASGEEVSLAASIVAISAFCAALAYALGHDAFDGRSIGRRICGTQVLHRKTGRPIGLGTSIARNLIFAVQGVVLIEILLVLFSKDGRRIGDHLTDTIVVHAS
jgi:uncharacterized RDD family membrane protein YckC